MCSCVPALCLDLLPGQVSACTRSLFGSLSQVRVRVYPLFGSPSGLGVRVYPLFVWISFRVRCPRVPALWFSFRVRCPRVPTLCLDLLPGQVSACTRSLFGSPSQLGHHKSLGRVPCAIQQVLMSYPVCPHAHIHVRGFPGGTRGKELTCQCRRCGFYPWGEKIP